MNARSWRRLVPKLLLAVTVGAVFFESGLRLLLTSPWTRDSRLARELGNPRRFAFAHEDLYWRFVRRLATHEAAAFEPPHDPALGWTWPGIEPRTYVHAEESRLGERRPVLLFGDSYSACLTDAQVCFQGLMESSDLAEQCQLLNYGVSGYGFDQICLLARAAVPRFAERDPVVVIGLLVDDDLTRSLLSLREYPKPRLGVEDGRLVVPQSTVPTPAQYRADPEPLPPSWAWAWAHQAIRVDPLEDPDSPQRREARDLTRALLAELVCDLRARDVEHFFLLFYVPQSFATPPESDWRTTLLCETLDELGAPWYDVRKELARRLADDGGTIQDFYIPYDHFGGGHYDADGNAAAFAVLRRGLEEVADLRAPRAGAPPAWAFRSRVGTDGGVVDFQREVESPFDRVPSETCLFLRAPRTTSTAITYELSGLRRRFAANLWAYDPDRPDGSFTLLALLDDRPVWERTLRPSDVPQAFELDLSGARTLELRLEPHGSRGCVVLSDPRLE